jgi:hypothetical protein
MSENQKLAQEIIGTQKSISSGEMKNKLPVIAVIIVIMMLLINAQFCG